MRNTENEWKNLIADYQNWPKGETLRITFDIKQDNIMDLRYAPLFSAILRHEGKIDDRNRRLKLIMNFQENGTDLTTAEILGKYYDVLSRIAHLFRKTEQFPELEVSFGEGTDYLKQKLKNAGKSSRIFPICKVAETMQPGSLSYVALKENNYNAAAGKHEEEGNVFYQLANELLSYIQNEQNYKGDEKPGINREKKEFLCEQVKKFLKKWIPQMDILSELIWLFILKELIEEKQLFYKNSETKELEFRDMIMQKSRMDAVTYGESMYQLIENSCLHSEGKFALFGFRMYHAGRNTTMSKLSSAVSQREWLYERYSSCFLKKSEKGEKQERDSKNIFNKDYSSYFEFYVLDAAPSQQGMVNTYNKAHPNRAVSTIRELFTPPFNGKTLEEFIDYITVHYGLGLLKSYMQANEGYLIFCSPDDGQGTLKLSMSSLGYFEEKGGICNYTECDGLLPVSYKWQSFGMMQPSNVQGSLFGKNVEEPRKKRRYLDITRLLLAEESGETKREKIYRIYGKLKNLLPAHGEDCEDLSKQLILMDLSGESYTMTARQMEIFAKALFAYLAWANTNPETDKREEKNLRIAIVMENQDWLCEFVRLYQIFYLKKEQKIMETVQLALCSREKPKGKYIVRAVLGGRKFVHVLQNAQLFTYFHAEDTLEYLPLIGGLNSPSDQVQDEGDNLSMYPFGLYLPAELPKGETLEDWRLWDENWFTAKVGEVIRTPLEDSDFGCKIEDVHFRIGSKLHVNNFYEAELLFHNTSFVQYFAYALVQELLYGDEKIEKNAKILLVGYEKYSAQLIQQMETWLKASRHFEKVQTAIVYDRDQGTSDVAFRCREKFLASDDIEVISVVPVGTTLSTFYKMHNATVKHIPSLQGKERFKRNFCLIIANHDLACSNRKNPSEETRYYWESFEHDTHSVNVCQEKKGQKGFTARYMVAADATWYFPENCPICRKSGKAVRPLVEAKRDRTIPSVIFPLSDVHKGRFDMLLPKISDQKENREHLRVLFGHVVYSHIYDGNNHFQFFMKYEDIYRQNKEEIDKKIRTWTVEEDAFHLVVSPLQMSNSSFGKAVLDIVFHGSARFLHIDLKDSYREEVRSKFSYIAEEYKRMWKMNPEIKFHVHFVDNSVVTGSRINRAAVLIKMLLNQSGVPYGQIHLFRKVFLLVNRCSYDTANSFVQDPETDFYAFLHLAVPSYNTENGLCPACKLVDKYRLMEKRSSTARLSSDFSRLACKHKMRTIAEYEEWIEEDILKNPSYCSWLRQWLFINYPLDPKHMVSFVPDATRYYYDQKSKGGRDQEAEDCKRAESVRQIIQDFIDNNQERFSFKFLENEEKKKKHGVKQEESQDRILGRLYDSVLGQLTDVTLEEINQYAKNRNGAVGDNSFKENVQILTKTHLIQVRNYMRLEAMQQAYEILEDTYKKNWQDREKKCDVLRKNMVRLIAERLKESNVETVLKGYEGAKNKKGEVKDNFILTYQVEWLLCYIKVLSREQIANYYACRQAVLGIMSDTFQMLRSKKCFDSKSDELTAEYDEWSVIISVIRKLYSTRNQLSAYLQYQLNIILLHRLSDLQAHNIGDSNEICRIVEKYDELVRQFFDTEPEKGNMLTLPPSHKAILRQLKSLKVATMGTDDCCPSIQMAETPAALDAYINNAKQDGQNQRVVDKKEWGKRYIYLENTRMLYAGMRQLANSMPETIFSKLDSRPADKFRQNIKELNNKVNTTLRNCYGELSGFKQEDIIHQNLLANFCKYWHKTAGEAPVAQSTGINPLTYMVQYYRCLRRLTSSESVWKHEELPYIYEEICRLICGFTGMQMCYIAYSCNGNYPEIFAQSGYYADFLKTDRIINSEKMEEMLCRVRKVWKDKQDDTAGKAEIMLIPGIVLLRSDMEDDMVITIPMVNEKPEEKAFFVVLQADAEKKVFGEEWGRQENWQKALRMARDILFMRYNLQAALSRDYTTLINFRYDCSYVRPITTEAHDGPQILHISDLHIMENLRIDWCKKMENATQTGKLKDARMQIDILAITGDIVDGRSANAPSMERNYEIARDVLNILVCHLWEDEGGYLSHDWKRRVIITTGNHDYASMNQFQVVQKRRALTIGTPVEKDGGTMSRFTYLIEFLVHYLDVPMAELLQNDLNEIRNYRVLDLKVISLNCSGTATPRRTNKMGVNRQAVDPLLKRNVWSEEEPKEYTYPNGKKEISRPFRLCLAHYAHTQQLTYMVDNYNILPGWAWDHSRPRTINELVDYFQNAVTEEDEVLHGTISILKRQDFMEEMKKLEVTLDVFKNGGDILYDCKKYEQALDDYGRMKGVTRTDVAVEMLTNDLYQQMKKYYQWLNETPKNENDEHISELLHNVSECVQMSVNDQKSYENLITDIRNNGGLDLLLAGHIHANVDSVEGVLQSDGRKLAENRLATGKQILIAGKFFDDSGAGVNGYILKKLQGKFVTGERINTIEYITLH